MEMPKYVNIPDTFKIGVMAFAFIWLANLGLKKLGMEKYRA